MFSRKTSILIITLVVISTLILTGVYVFPKNRWVNKSNILIIKFAGRVNSFWYGLSNKVSFNVSKLAGIEINHPTSLQFGPDGKLYVSSQDGEIYQMTIERNESGNYTVTKKELINLVKQIWNHSDDGIRDTTVHVRQVTGILVCGTAEFPKIYVSSSDPRVGGAVSDFVIHGDGDSNLDTNSGMISLLSWNGKEWEKIDIVRGLPRSEENHSIGGMSLDESGRYLLLTSGGNTNAGSPSINFTKSTEYALSACVLRIDLDMIRSMPVKGTGNEKHIYDLPTVDDPQRENAPDSSDLNDPFGGNDGLNQARIVPGGPVQVFAPGYRNAYDIVYTKTAQHQGNIYTVDNGANPYWGGYPEHEGTAQVSNNYVPGEPGSISPGENDAALNNIDNLHLVFKPGMKTTVYGGHPNPIRANPDSAGLFWNHRQDFFKIKPTRDWPPLPREMANPIEGDFLNPGVDDNSLTLFYSSTNGLTEYCSERYFKGAMSGDLVTANFDGTINRVKLNKDGTRVIFKEVLAHDFGKIPLDVTANSDNDIFPGTLWVADYQANSIFVMEPGDAPNWIVSKTADNSQPDARHETGFVEAAGKFYLIGGRGNRSVNVYDPMTQKWTTAAPIPGNKELNHFQAVTVNNKIYLVCAFTGTFPLEKAVPDIYVFDPLTNQWSIKSNIIPQSRQRGSAAAAVFNNKIYLTGGSTNGHTNGWVNWTDVYDPADDSWKPLSDAPHAKDHFQVALFHGRIYSVGGRRTNFAEEKLFTDTEPAVDVYDIGSNTWKTLPPSANLITPRGGASTVVYNNKIYIIGGESKQPKAHNQVEVFDPGTQKWTSVAHLNYGRHGTQGIVYNNKIFVATGCASQGGSPELNSMEVFIPK